MSRDFVQVDLFGEHYVPYSPPKKQKSIISDEERAKRKEKAEAHTAWKLLKSRKFKDFNERHKFLLQKYYGVEI